MLTLGGGFRCGTEKDMFLSLGYEEREANPGKDVIRFGYLL